ncbi:MAG: hypothetical protein CME62_01800 [Halobacteriovoraceae bacterium]|nr:hypothetical protein [Halobacteriovoraceae bacterium]
MSTFFHLLKFNLIFQKMRIAFLTVLAILMVLLVHYFMDSSQEIGESLMQYSAYILFVIFTGKLNAKNSQMFDIKHLLAFPLSKREIIFTKSVADLVQMSPVIITFMWGFYLRFPEYHFSMVAIIFLLALTAMNINAFSKRIDFFRMQHSKSHFRNMFLYAHKYLELMIVLLFLAISVSLIFGLFGENTLMMEYSLVILLTTAIFVSTMNALRMLKDETLSYFLYKRDIFRMGWKLMLLIGPGLMFHGVYKGKLGDSELAGAPLDIRSHLSVINNIESQRFMLAALTDDEEYLSKFMQENKPVPWETQVKGMYPAHAAVYGDHPELLEYLIKLRPEVVNKPGKQLSSTPLFVAMRECHLRSAEVLIQAGADINHRNKNGDTALSYAINRGCSGGVLRLVEAGADLKLKNKKGITDLALLESSQTGLYEYLRSKEMIPAIDFEDKQTKRINRSLASEKESASKKN